MQTDKYTKVILTLIAIGLFALFVLVGCENLNPERHELDARIESERIQVALDSLRAAQADSLKAVENDN